MGIGGARYLRSLRSKYTYVYVYALVAYHGQSLQSTDTISVEIESEEIRTSGGSRGFR